MMTNRTASCSCGQLTATTSADPVLVGVCHCLACQRRTGSVFAALARFSASAVVIAGISNTFVRVGDAGGRGTFHFCPTCGVTVYCTSEGREDSVAIPVGAFADPNFPAPTLSVYEERKHTWVEMPTDIEHIAWNFSAGFYKFRWCRHTQNPVKNITIGQHWKSPICHDAATHSVYHRHARQAPEVQAVGGFTSEQYLISEFVMAAQERIRYCAQQKADPRVVFLEWEILLLINRSLLTEILAHAGASTPVILIVRRVPQDLNEIIAQLQHWQDIDCGVARIEIGNTAKVQSLVDIGSKKKIPHHCEQ